MTIPATDAPAEGAPLEPAPLTSANVGKGIAIAALLIMVGNLASRIFGLVRESAITARFGTSFQTDLYSILSAVPNQLYDFLVGGLVSAALVPVLSDYVDQHDRANFHRLLSTIFTILFSVLAVFGSLIWVFAGAISRFLAPKLVSDPVNAALAISMLRYMMVAVLFMAVSGLLTGLLQAQRRFLLPAFTTSVFNIGIIVTVWFVGGDARVLAVGMLVGAIAQVILQSPGLRGVRLRPTLDLQHPGVRRIGRLYAPVALGISFSLIGTTIDRQLADSVGSNAASYMRNATTLVQFALGLVAAAISIAILPTLSRLNTEGDEDGFRRILGLGLKTVVLLIVPIMVILGVLGRPVIRIMFERGAFTPENTRITALALLAYLPSILAAAIDQPLIFAFYARKRTLLPNIVQGIAIVAYFAVALSTYKQWGMYGLIAGNVVQLSVHALVMAILAHRQLNIFAGQAMLSAFAKVTLAAGAMIGVCWGIMQIMPVVTSMSSALLTLIVAGGISGMVYLGLLWWLKLDALAYFTNSIMRRFKRT